MYIQRTLQSTFLRLSKEFPAILLTGPRQTGKTTMLRKLAQDENRNRTYVTLDDLQTRALAMSDPAMFFQLYKPPVLIDEIQYAPELLTYIKIHADTHQTAGDFWLTGSQMFRLMSGVRESLAGRVALLRLLPLSQSEICGLTGAPFQVDLNLLAQRAQTVPPIDTPQLFERLFRGAMPALAGGQYTDRYAVYSGYVGTYIERDIRELATGITALKFLNFITAAAAHTAQMLNVSNIAALCDIDRDRVKEWIQILEALGIIFLLHPYANNVLKRTVKSPKLYFFDTGLVCYLTKWSTPETAMNGAMSGALFENYAISEIYKTYANAGQEPLLYYYRDRDMKEIDLVIECDGQLTPIEIKKTASPDPRTARTFRTLERSTLPRATGAIVCNTTQLGAINANVLTVPAWLI